MLNGMNVGVKINSSLAKEVHLVKQDELLRCRDMKFVYYYL